MNILLFDIDFTLFETKRCRELTSETLIKQLKIKREEYDKATAKYAHTLSSTTDFHPQDFTKSLTEYFKTNQKQLLGVFSNKTVYEKCLYPDVEAVLKRLSKKYILGIYSEGFVDFQTKKIFISSIRKYFHDSYIYISRRKTLAQVIRSLPQGAVIVDDNLKVIEKLAERKDIHPIWLNRLNSDQDPRFTTIHDLQQLPDILNS